LVLAGLTAVAAIGVATRHRTPGAVARNSAATVSVRRTRHTPTLSPPPPIPGYLLIADRGNDRMLLVDSAKHVFWQYPQPQSGVAMPFRFDDDTFFGPGYGRIISNQEDQHTIQIVSFPGGRVLWRYGHVDRRGSLPGYLNTPDDAYLLPNGLISVADAYNCRVLFINHAQQVVRHYGSAGACRHDPPTELGAINGATPLSDGGTLVSEINGSWIDDISRSGRLRWAVQAPVSYPSDPQLLGPNRILLADYAHPGHALIMTASGRVLWRYGPASGPGELDHPSLAFRIAPGLIAINDDYRDRVVIVDIHTRRIVWQYGHTDRPGTAPGFLNTPDGLDLLPASAAQASPVLRQLMTRRRRTTARAATRAPVVSIGRQLPAPVQRAVAVSDGASIVVAGGLDAAGASTNGVFSFDPLSGRLTRLGVLPQSFHDAAGAIIGRRLFVFGGGASVGTATVQAFDLTTHVGRVVGNLPRPLSDVVSATIGRTVYLVGGFDNNAPRAEILATSDGIHFRVAGRLPVGLRYPAVAAVGGMLVIAGGVSPSGPTRDVYRFDPGSGSVTRLGSLPDAVAHAGAVTIRGDVYLIGGTTASNAASATIFRIDVAHRTVASVGRTTPVADAAVAGTYLIGGTVNGQAVPTVRRVGG
jgi:Kelch motif protein